MGFSSFPDLDSQPAGNTPIALGYGVITSGPTIGTTEVDLPGCTATVVVPAGRRLKITGRMFIGSPTVANNEIVLWLIEDGVKKHHTVKRVANAGDAMDFHVEFVTTPAAGTHTYKLSGQITVGAGTFVVATASDRQGWILVEDVTGVALPVPAASVPVGLLGVAYARADQMAIGTTLTDLVGMSVNVTVPAGRLLRIQGFVATLYNPSAAGYAELAIVEGGTTLALGQHSIFSGAATIQADVQAVISPTAGNHAYRIQARTTSGTINLGANASWPAFITVEDITPTPALASTAPSSTLGYAEATTAAPAIGAGPTDIPSLQVTVTVPEGRRLKISGQFGHFWYSDSTTTHLVQVYKNGVLLENLAWGPRVPAGESLSLSGFVIDSPAAGTHTYKLVASRAAGAGTVLFHAAATAPQTLLVEDITGTSSPIVTSPTGFWQPGTQFPAGPTHGDQFYDKTTNVLWAWNGSVWNPIGGLLPYVLYTGSGTGSTASASWTDYPGPINLTFTKRAAHTALHIHGHASGYKTTNAGNCAVAVLINGVDYELTSFFSNDLSTHRILSFNVKVATGLAAGTYQARLRWNTAATSFNCDNNDRVGISIMEALP